MSRALVYRIFLYSKVQFMSKATHQSKNTGAAGGDKYLKYLYY